jgi:flagellar biosynthesis protein FliP
MSVTVTRKGAGPALFRAPGRPSAVAAPAARGYRWALAALAIVIMLLIAAPAFAQAPAAPGVGDAVDRALGQLGGQAGGQSAPMSLSLQVLIIMAC